MNIKIAEEIIKKNGLYVSGFVAPEYFWYNNIADILEKRNYKNSNSLGFDYSNYPYNPVINEKLYNYIELPVECGGGPGICGRLNHWLHGFRPAAAARPRGSSGSAGSRSPRGRTSAHGL